MDSFVNYLIKNENNELKTLCNNLIIKGNLKFQNFNLDAVSIFKSNTNFIYSLINKFIKLKTFKNKNILRNISYLNKDILKSKSSYSISFRSKLSNINEVKKYFLLFYMVLFHSQIYIQNNQNYSTIKKYYYIKKLYNLFKKISTYIPKLYFDKIINIEDLEILLKMFVLFSINNYNNMDIRENNDLQNIMYLKESLKIIKIIYQNDSSQEEQNLLIRIFKYINNNICYSDKNNTTLNYANKFYMINNDHNTTKLLDLMNVIHKINNNDINNEYFELLSNIYMFQINYNNLSWPFYKLFEPLLINIDTKNYSSLLNEISFPEFQLNFIKYIISKERTFIMKNPCILSGVNPSHSRRCLQENQSCASFLNPYPPA